MDPEIVSKAIALQVYCAVKLAKTNGLEANLEYLQAAKAIAVGSIVANISGASVGDTFLDRVGTVTAVSTSITATALDDETEITLPLAETYAAVMTIL